MKYQHEISSHERQTTSRTRKGGSQLLDTKIEPQKRQKRGEMETSKINKSDSLKQSDINRNRVQTTAERLGNKRHNTSSKSITQLSEKTEVKKLKERTIKSGRVLSEKSKTSNIPVAVPSVGKKDAVSIKEETKTTVEKSSPLVTPDRTLDSQELLYLVLKNERDIKGLLDKDVERERKLEAMRHSEEVQRLKREMRKMKREQELLKKVEPVVIEKEVEVPVTDEVKRREEIDALTLRLELQHRKELDQVQMEKEKLKLELERTKRQVDKINKEVSVLKRKELEHQETPRQSKRPRESFSTTPFLNRIATSTVMKFSPNKSPSMSKGVVKTKSGQTISLFDEEDKTVSKIPAAGKKKGRRKLAKKTVQLFDDSDNEDDRNLDNPRTIFKIGKPVDSGDGSGGLNDKVSPLKKGRKGLDRPSFKV